MTEFEMLRYCREMGCAPDSEEVDKRTKERLEKMRRLCICGASYGNHSAITLECPGRRGRSFILSRRETQGEVLKRRLWEEREHDLVRDRVRSINQQGGA